MFHCVKLGSVHDRFFVRGSHADIKGSDDLISEIILAGNIDSRLEFDMVYGKAGYFFHVFCSFLYSDMKSLILIVTELCQAYKWLSQNPRH